MKMKKLSALVAVSILLSGCAIQRINKNVNAANDDIKDVSAGLHKTFETRPAVRFHTEQWINPTPIKISEKELPSKVINCNITYKPGKSVDIYQFGQDVAMLCGVPVR
ncbi:PilN family type IVB pilus formation outer membrane protein, partial [Enterobacter hormaechei]|nr:PilN family type IVB pilus formation outer membrane protein [Enterobacter hormaechei]